ncbi:EamA family transporter [Rhodovulum sp. DZ06]|uniref:EamA family transporter n=1 Tax=Rhodovulum sp. DZ06 TaxID=3425126 RepID=UPI003D345AB8
MSDFILSIDGTEAGARLALILALVSAVAHASFGALQKGRHDPWLSRGAIDACYGMMALPMALLLTPLPSAGLWWALAGAWGIHVVYKFLQAMAYSRGAYTVVYPVARGMGPLATVALAGIVFGESFSGGQWGGVALLSGGIMALAAVNLRGHPLGWRDMAPAIGLALLTGVMIALYTTYDAWGIRLADDPLTFLLWFFVVDGWTFPLIAAWRVRTQRSPASPLRPLLARGLLGALIAFLSFGAVMLATRLDKVGEAAALRETSVVFAGLIGWLVLGERVGPARAALMVVIALGAIAVEFA